MLKKTYSSTEEITQKKIFDKSPQKMKVKLNDRLSKLPTFSRSMRELRSREFVDSNSVSKISSRASSLASISSEENTACTKIAFVPMTRTSTGNPFSVFSPTGSPLTFAEEIYEEYKNRNMTPKAFDRRENVRVLHKRQKSSDSGTMKIFD